MSSDRMKALIDEMERQGVGAYEVTSKFQLNLYDDVVRSCRRLRYMRMSSCWWDPIFPTPAEVAIDKQHRTLTWNLLFFVFMLWLIGFCLGFG